MTYPQLTRYLYVLEKKDLIGKSLSNNNGETYHTTDKGMKLLESLKMVITYLK